MLIFSIMARVYLFCNGSRCRYRLQWPYAMEKPALEYQWQENRSSVHPTNVCFSDDIATSLEKLRVASAETDCGPFEKLINQLHCLGRCKTMCPNSSI